MPAATALSDSADAWIVFRSASVFRSCLWAARRSGFSKHPQGWFGKVWPVGLHPGGAWLGQVGHEAGAEGGCPFPPELAPVRLGALRVLSDPAPAVEMLHIGQGEERRQEASRRTSYRKKPIFSAHCISKNVRCIPLIGLDPGEAILSPALCATPSRLSFPNPISRTWGSGWRRP
jgi:hypothetical protein